MSSSAAQFGEEDITSLSELIWGSVLGLAVHRSDEPVELLPGETLVGCVQITGSWDGAVTLECPTSLARRVSAIMFGLNEEDTTLEFTQDALGELTNMMGGNIKSSLLPELSSLGLPTVVNGDTYSARVTDTRLVTRIAFTCLDQPFVVTLWNSPDIPDT